jgi:hypothetical protein
MSASGQYQTAAVCGGTGGFMYISSNYGVTWTQHRHISKLDSRSDVGVRTISNGGVISTGFMYISSNYGVTWTPTATSQNWYGVAMSASGQYQTAVVYSVDSCIFPAITV